MSLVNDVDSMERSQSLPYYLKWHSHMIQTWWLKLLAMRVHPMIFKAQQFYMVISPVQTWESVLRGICHLILIIPLLTSTLLTHLMGESICAHRGKTRFQCWSGWNIQKVKLPFLPTASSDYFKYFKVEWKWHLFLLSETYFYPCFHYWWSPQTGG